MWGQYASLNSGHCMELLVGLWPMHEGFQFQFLWYSCIVISILALIGYWWAFDPLFGPWGDSFIIMHWTALYCPVLYCIVLLFSWCSWLFPWCSRWLPWCSDELLDVPHGFLNVPLGFLNVPDGFFDVLDGFFWVSNGFLFVPVGSLMFLIISLIFLIILFVFYIAALMFLMASLMFLISSLMFLKFDFCDRHTN